jgi:hypothetical protein
LLASRRRHRAAASAIFLEIGLAHLELGGGGVARRRFCPKPAPVAPPRLRIPPSARPVRLRLLASRRRHRAAASAIFLEASAIFLEIGLANK